jgi:phosphohistidine phosphatase
MEGQKTLIILRHAKSSWEENDKSDFDRVLKEKGIDDIRLLASNVKDNLPRIDIIFSSPANRAIHTAILFAISVGIPTDRIRIVEGLYDTNELRVDEFVKSLPDELTNVVVVGHNPTSTDFVNLFLKNKIDNIPTSGMVMLTFTVQSWRDISPKNLIASTFNHPNNY